MAKPKLDVRVRNLLLEAARDHCAESGIDQTSVRSITKRAVVNSSMLGYYFGSKDALLREMVASVAQVLSAGRIETLNSLRKQFPNAIPLEQIVHAYAEPFLLPGHPLQQSARVHVRLIGRALAEPSDSLYAFFQASFADTQRAFLTEIQRSAPYIPEEKLVFRFGLMLAAMPVAGIALQHFVHDLSNGRLTIDHTGPSSLLDCFSEDWATLFTQP